MTIYTNIEELIENEAPHGSGINYNYDNFHHNKERVTFCNCYDLMDENGYYLAGSYLGDQVVESFGGGICQVSTTLYWKKCLNKHEARPKSLAFLFLLVIICENQTILVIFRISFISNKVSKKAKIIYKEVLTHWLIRYIISL